MPSIQTLPTDIVHLIAAGEVIDSPAAVVRELIENAVDAWATRITISLWPEQWRLRVSDNGFGMAIADLQQAASPHSTSKINTSDDLWRISSLGFRGEALHSLSQLAALEICSRPQIETAESGWRVRYDDHGNPAVCESVAIAPGSVVTVNNLFERWPARRAGLPAIPQQLRAIQQVIQQMALCHSQITWQVELRDRPWFQLWSGDSAQTILPQVLPSVALSDLRGVNVEDLSLVIGLPDRCHRRRPDWVQLALNGRPIHSAPLQQSVINGFRRSLPRDRFPVCFLHLHASPDEIDWNRHPAKSEIYLHHLDQWQQRIVAAIDTALQTQPESWHTERDRRSEALVKTAERKGVYSGSRQIGGSGVGPLGELKAIAQVHNTYILAESPSGVCLVEQHIAHERVLFEQLEERWQMVSQDPPMILDRLSAAQVTQLERLGLEIELFGENLWAVRSLPEPLANREDRADALRELSLGGDLQSALVATACRTAIRNGTPQELPQLQTLLNQWQRTRNPHTCPHGRPICLRLEESSLSRYFRRHWVIGKSHGI
ncbi:MAG: DNA mismatch repair endonuclease MutL [Cyanobacteria bacterium P01_C01_bin.73]